MAHVPFEELTVLAAAHAALDPERQKWRGDILISSLIEVLAVKGPLSERELQRQIRDIWKTGAVDLKLLHTALERAENGRLIERRGNGRDIRWAATNASAADAKIDRVAAADIIKRFECDVGERLAEPPYNQQAIEDSRRHRLTRHLIAAFIEGSKRVFAAVAKTGDPANLGNVDFDVFAVNAFLASRVTPAQDAFALQALAVAAFDPYDEFGNEILRLIVAGAVLQGMLGRRDLTGQGSVEGSILLLDTSVLVYRMEDPGAHTRLLDELFQVSRETHCDLVVTQAVVKEWDGLWLSAAKAAPNATDLPAPLTRRAKNVVLRNWNSQAARPRARTWDEFENGYRKIESWLADHGVRIIEDEPEDHYLVECMRKELMALSDSGENSTRSEAGAYTDAHSTAIVVKERAHREPGIPRAWLIAEDWLTNKAYRTVRPKDPFPVTASIESWLLMVSATRADDANRDLAQIVGDSAIMNSFFAVCASYSVDELVVIAEVLKKPSTMSPEELAEAVRTDFVAYAESQSPDMPAELLRWRAYRRELLVQRREERLEAAEQEKKARAQAEDEERRETLERIDRLEAANRRLRRTLGMLPALLGMAIPVAVAAVLGASVWWLVAGAAIWTAISLSGVQWVRSHDQSASAFILVMAAMLAWTAASATLAVAIAPPAAAQPPRKAVQQDAPANQTRALSHPFGAGGVF